MVDHLPKAMTTPEEESGWVEVPVAEGRLFIHDIEEVEVRAADGTVARQVSSGFIGPITPLPGFLHPNTRSNLVPHIEALREVVEHDWDHDVALMRESFAGINRAMTEFVTAYRRFNDIDPRQGEEVYVYDLLPGARVYVLEDVFTVDRVDTDAPLPTVWLKELPTSPLYFSEDEYIYLANETED